VRRTVGISYQTLKRLDKIKKHLIYPFSNLSSLSSNSSNLNMASASTTETATLAAGCFWSVELKFQREPGVLKTSVGYTGGQKLNPTYKETCTGQTGHAEAVQIEFDPKVVTFGKLLDIFFKKHDPTTLNRQGGDHGSQYRSAIFYHSPAQQQEAEERVKSETKKLGKQVVTEVTAFTHWWPAEEYHQQYLEKGGQCSAKGDNSEIRCYG